MKQNRNNLITLFVCAVVLLVLTMPAASQESTTPGSSVRKLTLADAVFVALTNNVTLRSAYLDRYLQRISLDEAERQYYLPSDPSLTLSLTRNNSYTAATAGADAFRTDSLTGAGNFTAELAIPTGGKFRFAWDNTTNNPDIGQDFSYSSGWSASFRQPLLKGSGLDNSAYNVRIARISEEGNVLSLKDTISGTISGAIAAFRSYKDAERQLVIAEMGLVRAKALYDYNKDMIEAGRLAGTEIVQAQADIAAQETSLINAKNSLDNSRLKLVQALYIDKNTFFATVDESQQLVYPPALEEALALTFQYRTDYQRALQNLEKSKLTLAKNKRNVLWQLDLVADTTDGASGTNFDAYDSAFKRSFGYPKERDWSVGLTLTIPIVYYMTADIKAYLTAKNELEKANMAFEKMKLDIEIEVQNALRNVDSSYRSLKSATLSRELSERKLEIEKEKMGAGRTTNFQLVSFQRDLQNAQISELAARTAYLNSLTNLDTTLGTTLATWKIDVRKEDDQIRQSPVKNETNPLKP